MSHLIITPLLGSTVWPGSHAREEIRQGTRVYRSKWRNLADAAANRFFTPNFGSAWPSNHIHHRPQQPAFAEGALKYPASRRVRLTVQHGSQGSVPIRFAFMISGSKPAK